VHPDADRQAEEIRALRQQNEALSARVEALSSRVDLLTARLTRSGNAPPAEAASDASSAADAPGGLRAPGAMGAEIPPDLAVVKVAPDPLRPANAARAPGRSASRLPRPAPPVPTAVAIQEPDPGALEALSHPGRRPLAAEADQELREARAMTGLVRAHALEDFTARYPQHPAADNALVEAASAYAAAGREDAACALSRRVIDEYPAGDAQSDALERLAACEARRGAVEAEQRLLARLRSDFPGTPAAQRAEARLSQNSGRTGETAPRDVPARSSP
jgi:hypothetical protein